MNNQIVVLEPVTTENLFPQGYILANPDLQRVFGKKYDQAVAHFQQYGQYEHRKQSTRDYYEWRNDAALQRGRFEKFRGCFQLASGSGSETFPIRFGSQILEIEDYQAESSNHTFGPFFQEISDNPAKLYADIGAGLRDVVCNNCMYVEVYKSLTTDVIIEPKCQLPFRSASLDGIGCFSVLEHVQAPWEMVAEFARVLKPGGKVFIDWPFLQPVHGFPSHYYNATREGVRTLFDDAFDIQFLATMSHQGPDFTISWVLQSLLRRISDPETRALFANKTVSELANEPPQSELWRRAISSINDTGVSELSCGNTLIGVRK